MLKKRPNSFEEPLTNSSNILMRLSEHKLVRYVFVGGSAYVIEMLALYVLRYVFDLSPLASVAVSFWIGFFVAFILQKIITFKNYRRDLKTISKQLFGYSALVAFNYAFTLIVVALFHDTLGVMVLRTVTIATITLWNFIIYSRLFSDSSNG